MSYIINFHNFLIESRGVATPSLSCIDAVCKKVFLHFKSFSNGDDYGFAKSFLIKNKSSDEFPISKIKLFVKYERIAHSEFSKQYPETVKRKNWNSLGSCGVIENGKVEIEVGIVISDSFNYEKDFDGLFIEIESTISHELNHAYEGHKRELGGYQGLPVALTWALDDNTESVPKDIWDIWHKDFGYLVYYSEPHEINAMIQEANSYVRRYGVDEMKKKCNSWINAEKMTNFSAEKIKETLSDLIRKNMNSNNPDEIMTKMKTGFIEKFIELEEEYEEKSSVSPYFLNKLSLEKFFSFFEDRINRAGNKIKRGILRQYNK